MSQRVTAIYEKGLLKPLGPLDLKEEEVVTLSVEKFGEDGSDRNEDEYLPLIAEDGDPNVTWEEVQAVLAKLPGSLTEDFDRERDERF
ncbi:MAG TPA: antitoxin family protein [Pirellulales bacterium]|jgi:predicted DNA-binding antitoxin AbrB/MazE fold protein|nr:antitoxin family protein [Pirellulales bacterium]